MQSILIVEDALETQRLISSTLSSLGYQIRVASSAEDALTHINEQAFDLILLDISLPDHSGFDLCPQIQSHPNTKDASIIFLTGKNDVENKITAFSLGAEDYIVKPFNILELRIRVESKMKKLQHSKEAEQTLVIGNLSINLSQHHVSIQTDSATKPIKLTPREFKLLYQLAKKPERVYSREQLLSLVWGDSSDVFDRTVDTHVCTLRKKLGKAGGTIESVQNEGYKFIPSTAQQAATVKKKKVS